MIQGMVISKEIDERKMGYRGSKSGNKPVKEQRADASSVFTVRCALVTMKVALRRNNSNLRLKITQ